VVERGEPGVRSALNFTLTTLRVQTPCTHAVHTRDDYHTRATTAYVTSFAITLARQFLASVGDVKLR